LSTRGVLVRSYRGSIHMVQVPIQLSTNVRLPLELLEYVVPHPSIYPTVEASGDALPGTKLLW
jgi:hypothetical protein